MSKIKQKIVSGYKRYILDDSYIKTLTGTKNRKINSCKRVNLKLKRAINNNSSLSINLNLKIMEVKNIRDLRDLQLDSLSKFTQGKIGNTEARTVAYKAGKIIAGVKEENDYNKRMHPKKEIPFLEVS